MAAPRTRKRRSSKVESQEMIHSKYNHLPFVVLLVILLVPQMTSAFYETRPTTNPPIYSKLSAVRIKGYDEAIHTINSSAETGELSPALDAAVRFLEVNSYRIYPKSDPSHVEDLWEKAQGSWVLTATTGSYRNHSFHPTPVFLPFSFALLDGTHFGNGVGLDEKRIGLAFLHQAHFHSAHRRLTVTHPDLYLGGHRIFFPDLLRPAVLKSIQEENPVYVPRHNKTTENNEKAVLLPTFVLIAASEKALIARGNQSGGLALWTRLPNDIRPVAYKEYPVERTTDCSQLLPQ